MNSIFASEAITDKMADFSFSADLTSLICIPLLRFLVLSNVLVKNKAESEVNCYLVRFKCTHGSDDVLVRAELSGDVFVRETHIKDGAFSF